MPGECQCCVSEADQLLVHNTGEMLQLHWSTVTASDRDTIVTLIYIFLASLTVGRQQVDGTFFPILPPSLPVFTMKISRFLLNFVSLSFAILDSYFVCCSFSHGYGFCLASKITLSRNRMLQNLGQMHIITKVLFARPAPLVSFSQLPWKKIQLNRFKCGFYCQFYTRSAAFSWVAFKQTLL